MSRSILDLSKAKLDGWSTAISDAEQGIQEAKVKISTLRKSIKIFKRLRDCGAPFPGEVKEQSEAKNDVAQK